jgi:hypothetical protein
METSSQTILTVNQSRSNVGDATIDGARTRDHDKRVNHSKAKRSQDETTGGGWKSISEAKSIEHPNVNGRCTTGAESSG